MVIDWYARGLSFSYPAHGRASRLTCDAYDRMAPPQLQVISLIVKLPLARCATPPALRPWPSNMISGSASLCPSCGGKPFGGSLVKSFDGYTLVAGGLPRGVPHPHPPTGQGTPPPTPLFSGTLGIPNTKKPLPPHYWLTRPPHVLV